MAQNTQSFQTCPSLAELEAFDRGLASDDIAERVIGHLELGCTNCDQALNQLQTKEDKFGQILAQAAATTITPAIPEIIGGCRIESEIAHGGMGVVYLAKDVSIGRVVALKRLAIAGANNPTARDRFQQEAKAWGKIEHPNVVRLYSSGIDEQGIPFLVMQFVDGPTMEFQARGHPLNWHDAAVLIRKVAIAIQACHSQNVLHRDLKPANILVGQNGEPMVTDFGLARIVTEEGSSLTEIGKPFGTPSYMSPEQAEGRFNLVDQRSDIYSLGATLYELLTGRPPFLGTSRVQTLQLVLDSEPIGPSKLQPGIPKDLETICLKCLEKLPGQRYQTTAGLADDMGRFLDGMPIVARPVSAAERVRRWAVRNKSLAALYFVCALIVVGIAIGFPIWQGQKFQLTQNEIERELLNQQRIESAAAARDFERLSAAWNLRWIQQRAWEGIQQGFLVSDFMGGGGTENLPTGWETQLIKALKTTGTARTSFLQDGFWEILDCERSPDGKMLATADSANSVVVWSIDGRKVIRRFGEPYWDSAFGRTASVPRKSIYLAKPDLHPQPETVAEWPELDCITSLAWAKDGESIFAVTLCGQVQRFWLADGKSETVCDVDEQLVSLAVDEINSQLLVGTDSGRLMRIPMDGSRPDTTDFKCGAILSLLREESSGIVFAGTNEGKLVAVREADFSVAAQFDTGGAVWEICRDPRPNACSVFVANESRSVKTMEFVNGNAPAIEEREEFTMSGQSSAGFVSLDLNSGQNLLFASDERGEVSTFDLNKAGRFIGRSGLGFDSRKYHELKFNYSNIGLSLPWAFQRPVTVRAVNSPDAQFVTAGWNNCIEMWMLPDSHSFSEARSKMVRVVSSNAGKNPCLAFDPVADSLLWAGDDDGNLRVIDVATDQLIDQAKAHSGAIRAILALPERKLVLTAGEDGRLRAWTVADSKIRAVGDLKFDENKFGLLSLASTADSKVVAAIDARANLVIWSMESGKIQYLARPGTDAFVKGEGQVDTGINAEQGANGTDTARRPLTGKLSFNSDGSLLAAFGQSLSAHVIDMKTMETLPTQLEVAASGGTAICWSPLHPHRLIVADSTRIIEFIDVFKHTRLGATGESDAHGFVSLVPSPDKKRVVGVNRGGRISFWDAVSLVPVFSIQSSLKDCCDVSMSCQVRQLAVVNANGKIEVWNSSPNAMGLFSENIPVVDVTNEWKLIPVFESESSIDFLERDIAFDSKGGLHSLVKVHEKELLRSQRVLKYVHLDNVNSAAKTESLVSANGQPRIAFAGTTALALDENELPMIVFSRPVLYGKDNYFFEPVLARRGKNGEWKFTAIADEKNWGHWPIIRKDADGKLDSVYHYDYDFSRLIRSSPDAGHSDQWSSKPVGWCGDGHQLKAAFQIDDRYALWFRFLPSNLPPYWHLAWETSDGNVERIADTRISQFVAKDRMGQLWGLGSEFHNSRWRHGLYCLNRKEWVWSQELPIENDKAWDSILFFAIGADDRPFLIADDGPNGRFLILRIGKSDNNCESIGYSAFGNITKLTCLADQNGEPAFFVSSTQEIEAGVNLHRLSVLLPVGPETAK